MLGVLSFKQEAWEKCGGPGGTPGPCPKPGSDKPTTPRPRRPAQSPKPTQSRRPPSTEKPIDTGSSSDISTKDPTANRPSLPSERHHNAAPTPKKFKAPPPKKERRGKFVRPKGDKSQTALGDKAEDMAEELGFRDILKEGRRGNVSVKEEGSSIDLEFDHSGKAYELKMCNTTSTEYRLKAKKKEKEDKIRYAKKNKLTPYTLIGVRDVDTGEVSFYASKKPGLTGAEVNDRDFDYLGTVKG